MTGIDAAHAQDWSAKAARRTLQSELDEAGVDTLLQRLQVNSLKRYTFIRAMTEAGLNPTVAASVHDVCEAICANLIAEESERNDNGVAAHNSKP